jgi:hypothetical protein
VSSSAPLSSLLCSIARLLLTVQPPLWPIGSMNALLWRGTVPGNITRQEQSITLDYQQAQRATWNLSAPGYCVVLAHCVVLCARQRAETDGPVLVDKQLVVFRDRIAPTAQHQPINPSSCPFRSWSIMRQTKRQPCPAARRAVVRGRIGRSRGRIVRCVGILPEGERPGSKRR